MLVEILLVGAVSGFIQGLSGFAFGLVATSLWAWMMEPQKVVPLVVLGSLLGQCVSILSVRHEIRVTRVRPFIIGGAIGAPLGATLLNALDAMAFRALAGASLMVYSLIMLKASHLPKLKWAGATADGCIGMVSAGLTGAFGMGGPPMILWCSLREWNIVMQRATYQTFFVVVQVGVLSVYIWRGIVEATLLAMFAWLAPAITLTSWLGSRVSRKYSDLNFQKIVFGLLLVSGALLVVPAARSITSVIWRQMN